MHRRLQPVRSEIRRSSQWISTYSPRFFQVGRNVPEVVSRVFPKLRSIRPIIYPVVLFMWKKGDFCGRTIAHFLIATLFIDVNKRDISEDTSEYATRTERERKITKQEISRNVRWWLLLRKYRACSFPFVNSEFLKKLIFVIQRYLPEKSTKWMRKKP